MKQFDASAIFSFFHSLPTYFHLMSRGRQRCWKVGGPAGRGELEFGSQKNEFLLERHLCFTGKIKKTGASQGRHLRHHRCFVEPPYVVFPAAPGVHLISFHLSSTDTVSVNHHLITTCHLVRKTTAKPMLSTSNHPKFLSNLKKSKTGSSSLPL